LINPKNEKPSQATFDHNNTPVLNFRAIEIEIENQNYLYRVWVSGSDNSRIGGDCMFSDGGEFGPLSKP